jgi:hypothetical protein
MKQKSEGLRISPKYFSSHWTGLSQDSPADWPRAVEIVRDRLHGRFLRFVDHWLADPFSGFVVLSVDCLLAETIQQFRTGATNGAGKSEKYIKAFLSGPRFQHDFDDDAKTRFFEDIRCGLLHQAEAKEMWLVRRDQPTILQKVQYGKGYILDVVRFHVALKQSLDDYFRELLNPRSETLRRNLWRKMEHIVRIRQARGLLYEPNAAD